MENDARPNNSPRLPLEAAIEYAQRGWAVFPVRAGDKKPPLSHHGCLDATTDLDQIRRWWDLHPNANVAVATGKISGIFVVDLDVKNGKPGLETQAEIQSRFRIETLTAATPNGGIHEFFRYPGPVLRNAVERLPGLDIRTDGGYVLVAPSVVDGRPYVWTHIVFPAEMPAGLIALLQSPQPAPTTRRPLMLTSNRLELIERARRYVAAVPGAVQGRAGDIATYKLACRLVRGFALDNDETLMLLAAWNWRCQPRWSERELVAKIESARRNGIEPIGARVEAAR